MYSTYFKKNLWQYFQFFLLLLMLLFIGNYTMAYSGDASPHWGYKGAEGPDKWSDLSPGYAVCKNGKSQSPINITEVVKQKLGNIEFHYGNSPLKITNNGHTLQIDYKPNSYIKISGKRYELLQFHFHSPSEHQVSGQNYNMEGHLVHKNNKGELAVVSIFMRSGKSHPLIEKLWKNFPKKKGDVVSLNNEINAADLLPQDQSYYHYSGSLTTPPCSEAVNWYVLTTPIEVSKEQIDLFLSHIDKNARPIQPINNREVGLVEVTGSHIVQLASTVHQPILPSQPTVKESSYQPAAKTHSASTTFQRSDHNTNARDSGDQNSFSRRSKKGSRFPIVEVGILAFIMVTVSLIFLYMFKTGIISKMILNNKIMLIVICLLGLMVISAVYSIIKIHGIGKETQAIAEEHIPLTEALTNITENQLGQAIWFERVYRFAEMKNANKDVGRKLIEAENQFNKSTKKVNVLLLKAEKIANNAIEHSSSDKVARQFDDILRHLKVIEKEHNDFDNHVLEVFGLVALGNIHDVEIRAEKIEKEEEQLNRELKQFLLKIEGFMERSVKKAKSDELTAFWMIIILSVFSVLLGLILSFFLSRNITRVIKELVVTIKESSEQVNFGAEQISESSQKMASDAQSQSASVEEASSGVEEISATVNEIAANSENNAKIATQLNNVVLESVKIATDANKMMGELRETIKENTASTEQTGKIIKVIEEIAFQTNLLALNAAVEAARAGQAGMGFAVVADEVRNLAQQSSEAAKSTSELLQDTIDKTKEGLKLTLDTEKAFGSVVTAINDLKNYIQEIAAASEEQSRGIEQVNQALGEIETSVNSITDKTQSNASVAEESAAASEELSAQADNMLEMVADMGKLVGHDKINGTSHKAAQAKLLNSESSGVQPVTRKFVNNSGQIGDKNQVKEEGL